MSLWREMIKKLNKNRKCALINIAVAGSALTLLFSFISKNMDSMWLVPIILFDVVVLIAILVDALSFRTGGRR